MENWKKRKFTTYKNEEKYLIEFTQEELIYEKVKCATDSIYVIENYFTVFDQTKNNGQGEIIPFILFPFQIDLIYSYEKNRFNITNKYRQAGISTVTCAWLATYIAFNSNRSVAIVANKLETARDELMKDVTTFIDMLPPFLHPKISDKDAATHKVYSNGSQVKAFATNTLRGYTPTFLFWDEAAWCENGESFWTGTLPTLSTGGNAALVSCVTKDTMVFTNNGLVEISEMIDETEKNSYIVGDYEVLGRHNKRFGNILKNNGFRQTKKIQTEHVTIEGTNNHKLWSYSTSTGTIKYAELRNIKNNHYLGLQYGLNIFGDVNEIKFIPDLNDNYGYFNYKITDKFIDLLSLFYHKGYIEVLSIDNKENLKLIINNLNDVENNIILEFLKEYINIYPDYFSEKDIKFTNNKFICNIQQSTVMFYYMGLDFNKKFDKPTNRTLTKFIRKFKGDLLIRFIKTYFNLNNKIIKNNNSFSVNVTSPIMGRQLQQILINYGVICSYDPTIKLSKKSIKSNKYLTIDLDYDEFLKTEKYDPSLFDQEIPLGIFHNVNLVLEKYEIKLPFGYYKRFQMLQYLDKMNDILSDTDKETLNSYVSKDIYWSKVIKIEDNKNQTYDFSLPNNPDDIWAHSVIYNGIIGHQTPNGLDPVFYKTYDKAKNGTSEFKANELYWYYDPRYSIGLKWKKKNKDETEFVITENNKKKYKELIADGWKPTSPWFESMVSKFNNDKKKIAQELECVVGDTLITVKNNETCLIEKIKIEDLYNKINISEYTVLNHNGDFVKFEGINIKNVHDTLKFTTNKNKNIEVTLNHILISKNGEVLSKDLNIGDYILTKDGFEEIINIKNITENKLVYDLIDVAIDSLYLTNDIVSHNCSFLGSGNNFIDEEHIRRIEESQACDPIRMEYEDYFWIWEDPIKDESYVMVVDVSTGAGDDYSTIIILKQHETHLEEVAEFKHKVAPDTLGVIAHDYGLKYNNAFAIVDITGGIGAMTMKTMLDMGYTNVHYSLSRHEPTKEKLSDYIKEDENGKILVPGFVISTSNRGMILTEMKRAIEANEVDIKSFRLTSEMKTFISTTNNRIADHRRSFNDDLLIALAMGIYVFSYDIKSVGLSIEKTKKMLSAITSSNSNYSTDTNNNIPYVNPNNPYISNNWLFKGLNR